MRQYVCSITRPMCVFRTFHILWAQCAHQHVANRFFSFAYRHFPLRERWQYTIASAQQLFASAIRTFVRINMKRMTYYVFAKSWMSNSIKRTPNANFPKCFALDFDSLCVTMSRVFHGIVSLSKTRGHCFLHRPIQYAYKHRHTLVYLPIRYTTISNIKVNWTGELTSGKNTLSVPTALSSRTTTSATSGIEISRNSQHKIKIAKWFSFFVLSTYTSSSFSTKK